MEVKNGRRIFLKLLTYESTLRDRSCLLLTSRKRKRLLRDGGIVGHKQYFNELW